MSEEISYQIIGDVAQVLEINLEPSKTLIADGGALLYLDEEILFELREDDGANEVSSQDSSNDLFAEEEKEEFLLDNEEDSDLMNPASNWDESVFDVSEDKETEGSLIEKLWTATKKTIQKIGNKVQERKNTEEPPTDIQALSESADIEKYQEEELEIPQPKVEKFSWFITHFTNTSEYIRKIAFTTFNSGIVLPIEMSLLHQNELIIQTGQFLCARKGARLEKFLDTDIELNFSKNKMFKLDKIQSGSTVFLCAEGHVIAKELENDAIRVNLFSLIAFESSLLLETQNILRLQSMNYEDETFFALLSGSGKYWLQTTNLQHLIYKISPFVFDTPTETTTKEENSYQMMNENSSSEPPETPIFEDEL